MPPKKTTVNTTSTTNTQGVTGKDKKIPQWTSTTTKTNAKNGKFAKATGGGTLVLSGAPRRWEKEHPNDIYIAGPYRIVGTLEELRNYFKSQKGAWTEDRLQEAVTKYGITKENYQTTMANIYNNEMEILKQINEIQKDTDKKKNVNPFDLHDLKSAHAAIKGNATTVRSSRKVATASNQNGDTRPSTKIRATDNMETRINNARSNQKIVDVSGWDPKDTKYKGVKMIKPPGEKSRKIIVDGLPLASSNLTNYIRAIGELPPNYATYIDLYKQKMENPCDTPFDTHFDTPGVQQMGTTQTITSVQPVQPPKTIPTATTVSSNLGTLPSAPPSLPRKTRSSPKRNVGGKK